jgi:carotenoid cleavage dioxygenase
MVHGVRLGGGKAPWYRSRYVQTEILGAPPAPGGPPELRENPANTSVVHHANRLLCLVEIGLPYEISPADLATIGAYDYAGLLTGPMTAHPKIDPVTGEMLFFGYNLLSPSITYHRVDPQGVLVASENIPLPASVMMHDFQVTETHVIFLDLPVVFDLNLAIAGSALPFIWKPDNGARIGVMPRTGTAADVQWIDIDPCFVFHTWNAFHEMGDPNRIHVDAVRYPTTFEDSSSSFSNQGVPGRFTLSVGQGTATWTPFDDRQVEFPRISSRRQGLPYRYGYGITAEPRPPPGEVIPANRIIKYDQQTGTSAQHILPVGHDVDEAIFVPDPAGSAEDDGWLLAYVFDHAVNRSHLLILDATSLTSPVARVLLPSRIPHGFHGDFVPGAG